MRDGADAAPLPAMGTAGPRPVDKGTGGRAGEDPGAAGARREGANRDGAGANKPGRDGALHATEPGAVHPRFGVEVQTPQGRSYNYSFFAEKSATLSKYS